MAFFNTALIVREDLIRPLRALESSVETVAAGSLDAEPPDIEQDDEVVSLSDSFARMQETLRVTGRQADALASESFNDPVLDRSVPGAFGESLDRMAENLSTAIADLEARSDRLSRLIEEFETASARASDGDLDARFSEDAIDDRFSDVVESYNDQLAAFETTVGRAKPFARRGRRDAIGNRRRDRRHLERALGDHLRDGSALRRRRCCRRGRAGYTPCRR